jgi:hypothetical protein
MPEDAAAAGRHRLRLSDRFQILASEFEVETDLFAVHALLRGMMPHVEQQMPVANHHRIAITSVDDEYHIVEDGGEDDFELTPEQASVSVAQRIFRQALADMPDHIQLRAATLAASGRTFLVAGRKRTGKTTLAVHLLIAGWDVAGDDLSLLRDGEAVALPWRFLVPETSVALLPAIGAEREHLAFGSDPSRSWGFMVDPLRLGRPWRIAPAPVDVVLLLEPNFGARTEIVPAGKLDMMRHLLTLAGPPPSRRRDWIGDLTRLVEGSETFTLRLGTLESAAPALERALS